MFCEKLVKKMFLAKWEHYCDSLQSTVSVLALQFYKPACSYYRTCTVSLHRFILDLDEGLLHLTFTETVNGSSFRIEEFAIQETFTALSTDGVVLSEKSSTVVPSHIITVNLSENALNALKADTEVHACLPVISSLFVSFTISSCNMGFLATGMSKMKCQHKKCSLCRFHCCM